MDNNISKKSLRHEMSCKRDMLMPHNISELSRKIYNNLISLNVLTQEISVLTYVSYKSEVKTDLIIEHCFNNDISVYVPRVAGKDMDFYKISSYSQLDYGAYGILEPTVQDIYIDKCENSCENYYKHDIQKTYDIIIMPGLIFDVQGNRLGYGGGYYDRYLNKHKNLYKIAICYDFQITDNNIIPAEPYDVKPDIIVTDKRIINVI